MFPETVQLRSEEESEKKFGLLVENEHEALVSVRLIVAVTVTQVPGGPAEGRSVMSLSIPIPVFAALT